MKFTRNINDEVIVKLTPKGERVYTMNAVRRDKLNNESVYSFPIWELMSIFGNEISGTEQLFVNNKLVFPNPIVWELPAEPFVEHGIIT